MWSKISTVQAEQKNKIARLYWIVTGSPSVLNGSSIQGITEIINKIYDSREIRDKLMRSIIGTLRKSHSQINVSLIVQSI